MVLPIRSSQVIVRKEEESIFFRLGYRFLLLILLVKIIAPKYIKKFLSCVCPLKCCLSNFVQFLCLIRIRVHPFLVVRVAGFAQVDGQTVLF